MAGLALKKNIKDIERVDHRAGGDTIRLWEGYRDQAYMWRAISLIQIPGTALAIIFAMILYFYRDTIIEVPRAPQPGHYSVNALPDTEYVNVGLEIVNLIATFQPNTVRTQFTTARKYLWEPALTVFQEQMMGPKLTTILETARSQLFFVSRKHIKVERYPDLDKVIVRIPGALQKLIGDRPLPVEHRAYYVQLTTIPRNPHNPYGIVAVEITIRPIAGLKQLEKEDFKVAKKLIDEENKRRSGRAVKEEKKDKEVE